MRAILFFTSNTSNLKNFTAVSNIGNLDTDWICVTWCFVATQCWNRLLTVSLHGCSAAEEQLEIKKTVWRRGDIVWKISTIRSSRWNCCGIFDAWVVSGVSNNNVLHIAAILQGKPPRFQSFPTKTRFECIRSKPGNVGFCAWVLFCVAVHFILQADASVPSHGQWETTFKWGSC